MTRIRPDRSRRVAFTLMELLVVIAIIIVMTAMAIPAISKFLDGQSLAQSGRIIQSAFNEARRAAITQRARNYLILFRQANPATGEPLYGLRRYRDQVGYEGESQFLLPNVQLDIDPSIQPPPTIPSCIGVVRGLRLLVFENCPDQDDAALFANRRPKLTDTTLSWIEFRKDGTIKLVGLADGRDRPPPSGMPDLFNLNVPVDSVPDSIVDDVDMNVREGGSNDVDKRCLLDVDSNTGRAAFRVVNCTAGT